MQEVKFELSGWKAVVVIVVLLSLVVARFMSLDDMQEDADLMQQIDTELKSEYSPRLAEKLRTAFDTGDKGKLEQAAKSVTSTNVDILSVEASYPVFDFATPKDVAIKVVYSLNDVAGTDESRTIYCLFRHGVFGWQYQHESTSLSYYLNFI